MNEMTQRTARVSSGKWCGTRVMYNSHELRNARPFDRSPSKSFGAEGLSLGSDVPDDGGSTEGGGGAVVGGGAGPSLFRISVCCCMMVAFWACSLVNSSSRISIRCGSSGSGCIFPAVGIRGKISELAVSNDSVLSEESSSSPKEPMLASGGSEVLARMREYSAVRATSGQDRVQGLGRTLVYIHN
jgi:hypothetical protein